MKDNVIYDVVREFINEFGDVEDFVVIDGFVDYTKALEMANKENAGKGEQISIWETDEETLDLLNSWIIKEYSE